jgi:GT2 family glycosyltransferase
MTSITIVTPWLEHPELVADYTDAVLPELLDHDEVIVVDNGDAPGLPYARTITAGGNLGYAKGSNLGLERATTDAVLFLNNDVRLGRRGWLDQIREAVRPGVLVGPLRDPDHAAVDGVRFPYIDGWCLAGMTDDLAALGGFDVNLEEPAYYSDNLLCLAAREAGMTLRHLNVGLHHKLSATAGPDGNPDAAPAAAHNRALYITRARSVLANL